MAHSPRPPPPHTCRGHRRHHRHTPRTHPGTSPAPSPHTCRGLARTIITKTRTHTPVPCARAWHTSSPRPWYYSGAHILTTARTPSPRHLATALAHARDTHAEDTATPPPHASHTGLGRTTPHYRHRTAHGLTRRLVLARGTITATTGTTPRTVPARLSAHTWHTQPGTSPGHPRHTTARGLVHITAATITATTATAHHAEDTPRHVAWY